MLPGTDRRVAFWNNRRDRHGIDSRLRWKCLFTFCLFTTSCRRPLSCLRLQFHQPLGGKAVERLNLVGAILLEQNDEWAVQRARYMTLETIAPLSDDPTINLPAIAG
jgi:hypothetical protein